MGPTTTCDVRSILEPTQRTVDARRQQPRGSSTPGGTACAETYGRWACSAGQRRLCLREGSSLPVTEARTSSRKSSSTATESGRSGRTRRGLTFRARDEWGRADRRSAATSRGRPESEPLLRPLTSCIGEGRVLPPSRCNSFPGQRRLTVPQQEGRRRVAGVRHKRIGGDDSADRGRPERPLPAGPRPCSARAGSRCKSTDRRKGRERFLRRAPSCRDAYLPPAGICSTTSS